MTALMHCYGTGSKKITLNVILISHLVNMRLLAWPFFIRTKTSKPMKKCRKTSLIIVTIYLFNTLPISLRNLSIPSIL